MNRFPGPRSVLVLDNAAVHRTEQVQTLCAEHGVRLLYLPPYSPDYNPIESCFSKVKAFLKRYGHDFDRAGSNAYVRLYWAFLSITRADIRGWIRKAHYSLPLDADELHHAGHAQPEDPRDESASDSESDADVDFD